VFGQNDVATTQQARSLNGVSQLAHVARPRVGQKAIHGSRRQADGPTGVLAGEPPGQWQNVLAAFAERRDGQLDHVQPVEQVFAERPCRRGGEGERGRCERGAKKELEAELWELLWELEGESPADEHTEAEPQREPADTKTSSQQDAPAKPSVREGRALPPADAAPSGKKSRSIQEQGRPSAKQVPANQDAAGQTAWTAKRAAGQ